MRRTMAHDPLAVWIGPLLVAAFALLVVAWFLPIMTITRFWFWSEGVSLIDAVRRFWTTGDYFLFMVIGGFSILFPALKLLLGFWVWGRVDPASRRGHWTVTVIQVLGKWSMVDVFVVALVVVGVQGSVVADVAVHSGVYVFTAAVVLSMLALWFLEHRMRKIAAIREGTAR